MATTRVRGGYDYQFVEEPPHELKCVICLAVARQPQQHGECGKLFCNSCLTQHRQLSNKCPNCDLQLITFFDGKSEYMYRVIMPRRVYTQARYTVVSLCVCQCLPKDQ